MTKFRKKPVVIEAFQLTYDVAKGVEPIPSLAVEASEQKKLKVTYTHKIKNSQYAEIETLEGTMLASANDWIIQGINGEIYPCKPDIFSATYEEVLE